MPTEPESREYHLTESKPRSKSREIANGNNADQVEEQAHQACVGESKKEEFLREKTNSERGYHHISGEPLHRRSVFCIFTSSQHPNLPSSPRSKAKYRIVHFPEPSRCLFARRVTCRQVAELLRTDLPPGRTFRLAQHLHRHTSHCASRVSPHPGRKIFRKPCSVRILGAGAIKASRIPCADVTRYTTCVKLFCQVHGMSQNDVEVIGSAFGEEKVERTPSLNSAACDGSRSATRSLPNPVSANHPETDTTVICNCRAITAMPGLLDHQNTGSLFGAMSHLMTPAHMHWTFLPHVTQLHVDFPSRVVPGAGDASVPLSRARYATTPR
jgi:hypothetical protein